MINSKHNNCKEDRALNQPCPGSKTNEAAEGALQGVQVAGQAGPACPAVLQQLFQKATKARRLPNFLPVAVGAALVESQSRMRVLTLPLVPKELILFLSALVALVALVGAWIPG